MARARASKVGLASRNAESIATRVDLVAAGQADRAVEAAVQLNDVACSRCLVQSIDVLGDDAAYRARGLQASPPRGGRHSGEPERSAASRDSCAPSNDGGPARRRRTPDRSSGRNAALRQSARGSQGCPIPWTFRLRKGQPPRQCRADAERDNGRGTIAVRGRCRQGGVIHLPIVPRDVSPPGRQSGSRWRCATVRTDRSRRSAPSHRPCVTPAQSTGRCCLTPACCRHR